MECSNCGQEPIPGVVLYRANAKGDLHPIWLCVPCGGRPPNGETGALCEALSKPRTETES